jgi:hypothetical protein
MRPRSTESIKGEIKSQNSKLKNQNHKLKIKTLPLPSMERVKIVEQKRVYTRRISKYWGMAARERQSPHLNPSPYR